MEVVDNLLQAYNERERESKLLNWMRFPLAVGVVFVHNPNPGMPLCKLENLSLENALTNVWYQTSGHLLCDLCVPLFFVISGFFYFYNIDGFTKDVFRKKTQRRVKSLLVPYLIWCIMPTIWPIFRKIVGMIIHHHGPEQLFSLIHSANWSLITLFYDDGSGMPFNFPLWFLRDLMFMSLCTPIIHRVVSKTDWKGAGLLIFVCLCLGKIPLTACHFLSAIPYFIVGAYIAIKNFSPYKFAHFLLPVSLVVAVILVPFYLYYDSPWIGKILTPLLLQAAMYLPRILFSDKIPSHPRLDRSVFFIYAAHGQMCLYAVDRWLRSMSANIENALIYVLDPIVTICILVIVCNLLCSIFPRIMSVILGRDVTFGKLL